MALARQEPHAAFLRVQFQHRLAQQVLTEDQRRSQPLPHGQRPQRQDGGAQGVDPHCAHGNIQRHPPSHLGPAADAIGHEWNIEGLGQAQSLEQAAIDDGVLGPGINEGAHRLPADGDPDGRHRGAAFVIGQPAARSLRTEGDAGISPQHMVPEPPRPAEAGGDKGDAGQEGAAVHSVTVGTGCGAVEAQKGRNRPSASPEHGARPYPEFRVQIVRRVPWGRSQKRRPMRPMGPKRSPMVVLSARKGSVWGRFRG